MKFYIDTELINTIVYYIIRDKNRVCYGYYINKEDCVIGLNNLIDMNKRGLFNND